METLNCLRLGMEGTNLILVNECGEDIRVYNIEVKYYVTGALALRHVREEDQLRRARRMITERISVDKILAPGSSLTVYFGVIENVVEVYAEVLYRDRRIRVKLM